VIPLYYSQYIDLINTLFTPERFDPLVDRVLGNWVPESSRREMKDFVVQRISAVLEQIQQQLTITSELPIVNGYHQTETGTFRLSGTANSTNVRSVLVDGLLAEWSPRGGLWDFGGASSLAETLVDDGSAWQYLDDGSDQGDAWRETFFDDSTWLSGQAQLGYGDGDETTIVGFGPDDPNKYITTYFRHWFNVTDASIYSDLRLRLLRDDGAIVYLNGVEVARSNMPAGDAGYGTRANSNVAGANERAFFEYPVDPGLLRDGENLLAVEIHQFSRTSADISFDLSLEGLVPLPPTEGTLNPGLNRVVVQAFDGPDGTGTEVDRGYIDIWYDTGTTNDYPRDALAAGMRSVSLQDAGQALTANLFVRDSYLPGIPVLVRVEVVADDGRVDRDLWDAVATLSVDNPGVVASTDQIVLYNGLGSALVTFAGTGDFTMTVDVVGQQVSRSLTDLTGQPTTSFSGTLPGSSTIFSGIVHITDDLLVPAGHTLTIQPGSLILIDGVDSGSDGTDIDVRGGIESLGTAAAPVTFTAYTPGENWGELHHVDAEPSTFQYTNITQAGHSPRIGHSNSGPTIRASGSTFVFDNCNLTDNAGKLMHATSGCDLTFRNCLFARSIMGPEISGTALLFEDSWITDMHGQDDNDGIYIHGQQAGQLCTLTRGVAANMDDDGIDTLGSEVTVQDFIVRDCKDKAISVYGGEVNIDHCLVVENNKAPEDPTVATIATKTVEGATAVVNIDHTTIVTWKTPGVVDVGIQSHNKYGVTSGTIIYNVTNSIIDATDPVDVQDPYVESDIHIDYSDIFSETWPGTGNLNADPTFVDRANHDYRLQDVSPCINAGDPGADPDPDLTVTDQGYFWTEQLEPNLPTGSLGEDTVWLPEQGPYRVTGELTIPRGITLEVMPGTTVFFEPDAKIVIHGRLIAEGTEYELIRFTRTPGAAGTWDGLQFKDTTSDNRIAFAVIEYGRTNDGMIGLENSKLLLDHVTLDNTDLRRIRTIDSSLIVRDCVFVDIFGPNEPPSTDNRSEHIWGGGIPEGGQFIVENNIFGTTKGHNDAIDVDGPSRPSPIPQILNNVFTGGGDDALDLESDAHIEGNVFMNYTKDEYNRASGESNVISAGAGKEYVMVRNLFYNVQHVAQVKNDAFLTFVNNTVSSTSGAAIYFDLGLPGRRPGRGAYADGNIFWDAPDVFEGVVESTELAVHRSVIPVEWHDFGQGNIDADPVLVDADGDFHLMPSSP
ncbi:MAG: right-handed parallel beta-helix repeat-containing protein, partial [Phycisphaerales bacterium]